MKPQSPFYAVPPLGNPKLACRLTYHRVFTAEFIDFLGSLIDPDAWQTAAVGPTKQEQQNIRNTLQQPLPPQHCESILEHLIPHLQAANENLWRFDIHGFDVQRDPPNFLSYRPGGHYDWHVDLGRSASTRKLGFIIPMSPLASYQGGSLQVFPALPDTQENYQQLGNLIIFPAYVPHRITPVTKGRRDSLVGWLHGPAFR